MAHQQQATHGTPAARHYTATPKLRNLATRNRVLFGKLTVIQLVKKLPVV
jgi:hypothetical protein